MKMRCCAHTCSSVPPFQLRSAPPPLRLRPCPSGSAPPALPLRPFGPPPHKWGGQGHLPINGEDKVTLLSGLLLQLLHRLGQVSLAGLRRLAAGDRVRERDLPAVAEALEVLLRPRVLGE